MCTEYARQSAYVSAIKQCLVGCFAELSAAEIDEHRLFEDLHQLQLGMKENQTHEIGRVMQFRCLSAWTRVTQAGTYVQVDVKCGVKPEDRFLVTKLLRPYKTHRLFMKSNTKVGLIGLRL